MPPSFEDKFIAFVDILGFGEMVAEAERTGDGLDSILELVDVLTEFDPTTGPVLCPSAKRLSKDLNFKRTQISDCVVMSVEVSPAGILNLLMTSFGIVLRLMHKGHLCRGFVTRGNIHHTNTQFIGTGYMEAVNEEKSVSVFKSQDLEKGLPFIQLNKSVSDYAQTASDDCIKK